MVPDSLALESGELAEVAVPLLVPSRGVRPTDPGKSADVAEVAEEHLKDGAAVCPSVVLCEY